MRERALEKRTLERQDGVTLTWCEEVCTVSSYVDTVCLVFVPSLCALSLCLVYVLCLVPSVCA